MKDFKKFLREFNDAWAKPDIESILAGVTDDIRFRMANSETPIEGKAAFADWLKSMDSCESQAHITIERLIVDGDYAALNGDITFSGRDAGKHYVFCDIYTLRGDRISELTAYCLSVDESAGMS
ncbi:nuclear transport factor 2 family protein [Allohahella sp. A8]|uniref:nuclear transport factor 2 family protein n=1 Tax=Allohahella sp. A8 TaxID=3141461 RepID=UPI003A80CFFB